MRIRIGISACLLGQAVRYDGGHKRDPFITGVLGADVEFVPVCPEVEMGLGTPREPMRLVRRGDTLRMVTVDTGIDHADRLRDWAAKRLEELASEQLSGYILKASSPSCGLHAVNVFHDDGVSTPSGRGLFATALTQRFPHLPVIDEQSLADPDARDAFMRQVLACRQPTLASGRAVSVVRVSAAGMAPGRDEAAVEEPLEIRLHGKPFVVTMRTPGLDRELAAGFLLAEGVITSANELSAVEHCRHPDHAEAHNVVDVFLAGDARARLDRVLADRRNVATTSSCGLCGRVTIDSLEARTPPLASRSPVTSAVIHGLPAALRARQATFDRTGGLHGAALVMCDGTVVAAAEDVGRHNAVDKVIGSLLLRDRLPLTRHVLVVSGRTSFEIVQKAWIAGVEMICAVSAPSTFAIDVAQRAGITLLGFVRDGGFNAYTHPDRLR